jgi:hypothetical protein
MNCKALTRDAFHNPRLKAEEVGWISGSASTEARDIGGCAAAYPPYILSEFLVFYDRISRVRH